MGWTNWVKTVPKSIVVPTPSLRLKVHRTRRTCERGERMKFFFFFFERREDEDDEPESRLES